MQSDAAAALEPFRKYLPMLAQLHPGFQLPGKLDSADLVQQAPHERLFRSGAIRMPVAIDCLHGLVT